MMWPAHMNRFSPPASTPSPKLFTKKCVAPPAEGKAAPSLAYEYVDKSATTPPMANASHIALPAACATTPRIEKIPAPTIPPIPIETAATRPIRPDPGPAADEISEDLAGGMGQPGARVPSEDKP